MDDLEARIVSRVVWHQTRPRNALLDITDPADSDGRYHRAGQAGAWYASSSERGAWAELFRIGVRTTFRPSTSGAGSVGREWKT